MQKTANKMREFKLRRRIATNSHGNSLHRVPTPKSKEKCLIIIMASRWNPNFKVDTKISSLKKKPTRIEHEFMTSNNLDYLDFEFMADNVANETSEWLRSKFNSVIIHIFDRINVFALIYVVFFTVILLKVCDLYALFEGLKKTNRDDLSIKTILFKGLSTDQCALIFGALNTRYEYKEM